MALYDIYEPYRKPLTAEENAKVAQAEEQRAHMAAALRDDPAYTKVPGGWQHEEAGFQIDPTVLAHITIAMQRADSQFREWPVMPEDVSASLRFPGVDPVGKYSVIDMKVAQRMARINAMLESRTPEVRDYMEMLFENGATHFKVREMKQNIEAVSREHRLLTRASKLCLDPEGRQLLLEKSRRLEMDPAVVEYDKYLQSLEYAAGVKNGPVPQELQDWHWEAMRYPIDLKYVKLAEKLDRVPRKIQVEFQNLDNKLLQSRFANPRSWDRSPASLQLDEIQTEEAVGIVSPYARATAERVIDPLFRQAEAMGSGGMELNRGDLIIVDGKTIREKMFEDFRATGQDLNKFRKYYQENLKQATNEYVAAGLMAGKRVEAFIPDKNGRIPDEPVQITKTGYEPSPLGKVTLNAWERFFAKRGFYKEKVAKAAEYERMQTARERVKTTNLLARLNLENGVQKSVKNQFFADWTREHGPLPDNLPNGFLSTRSAVTTIAMCARATAGHPVADILDPTKLQDKKLEFGSETARRMLAGDQEWIGKQLFHGQRHMMDFIDQTCRTLNVLDEKQLFSEQGKQLLAATYVAFDANQEVRHCKEEVRAAAVAYAPERGEEAFEEMYDRTLPACTFFRHAMEGMKTRLQLAGGMAPNPHAALRDVLNYEAAKKSYAEAIKTCPQVPISKQYTMANIGGFFDYGGNVIPTQAFEDVGKSLENPATQRNFGRSLMDGRMQKRLNITNDMQRGAFDFKLEAPSNKDIKLEEQSRTVQEVARQNALNNPMGGGGGRVR